MSIFDAIAKWRRNRAIKAAIANGASVPSRDRLARTWMPRWLRGDYTLQNSELLFSAVSRISNSLSAMPVRLYRGSTVCKNDLNDLVSFSPNPNMTSCQFFKTLEACRDTSGNAYAMKVYGPDGTLERLDALDPSRVRPIMERDRGELWYHITPENGNQFYVHGYHILHIPFISTNGYSGVNPVSVLYDTLRYADDIQGFSVSELEQGLNAAIVLEAPANLGDQQKKDMIESFMSTYRETSGNILLLESGVTAKSLNLSPVDTNLFEVEKITRSKVAMVYNIPPHLLGDYSDASFASQEQQMLEFLQLTMLPIVTAYEQEMNRKLLTRDQRRNGYHFEFDMDAILRADAATQAEVDYKAVRSGWKTPDEIRASRSLPALPNGIGKHPLVSQDLAPLSYTVNEKPKVLASRLQSAAVPQDTDNNAGKEE